MAPDVNSMPTSPRAQRPSNSRTPSGNIVSSVQSRRQSQAMGPPSVPASATTANTSASSMFPATNRNSVGMARRISTSDLEGPLRHPRPLTAAELYAECEKEQEAVVNRLTRELTALRAQTASVASNASHSSTSTSASLLPVDISDPNPAHQIMGPTHPTPSRRHRSSSSLSARSIPTPSTSASGVGSTLSTQAQAGSTAPSIHHQGGTSQASFDRAAAAVGGVGSTSASISRQPSISARSGTSTPARQSLDAARNPSAGGPLGGGTLFTLPHRPSLSRDTSFASNMATHGGHQPAHPLPSPGQSPHQPTSTSPRETSTASAAAYRSEMEIVKAENEALRQRVRTLERQLNVRRRDSSSSQPTSASGRDRDGGPGSGVSPAAGAPATATWSGIGGVAGPRERSESQSTTASSRRGGAAAGGGVNLGEDEVRFGESAGGLGRGG